jgi:type I restriction enzyme M protein
MDPRDAVKLMIRLMFDPIADKIPSGSYLLYDGAMGTGGMLAVAEETLKSITETRIGYEISFTRHFYKPAPMRTLAEIQADICALEAETEDLIAEIAGGEQ